MAIEPFSRTLRTGAGHPGIDKLNVSACWDLDELYSSVLLWEIKHLLDLIPEESQLAQKLRKSQHREKQVVSSCVPAFCRSVFPEAPVSYPVCISLQLSVRCSFH
jgi:hypothetical protein